MVTMKEYSIGYVCKDTNKLIKVIIKAKSESQAYQIAFEQHQSQALGIMTVEDLEEIEE